MSRRTKKISELVQQETAKIIKELSDPKLKLVTITDARVSPDLKRADVWFSSYQEEKDEVVDVLDKHQYQIQKELNNRLSEIKNAPKINFKKDPTIEKSAKIDKILSEIKNDKTNKTEGSNQ